VSTKTPYFGGGGFMFMDIKYLEFSMGILGAGGTSSTNTSPKTEWDYSFAAMEMGFFGKYPFAIGEKLTVFPLLGLKIQIVLGLDTEEKGEQYEPKSDDLTTFWLQAGGGLDVSLSEKMFLRGEFLYGVRLPNESENDAVDAASGSGIDADPLLGHGLCVKLGLGYKF
jgi:opacity protein-like surface antigen